MQIKLKLVWFVEFQILVRWIFHTHFEISYENIIYTYVIGNNIISSSGSLCCKERPCYATSWSFDWKTRQLRAPGSTVLPCLRQGRASFRCTSTGRWDSPTFVVCFECLVLRFVVSFALLSLAWRRWSPQRKGSRGTLIVHRTCQVIFRLASPR